MLYIMFICVFPYRVSSIELLTVSKYFLTHFLVYDLTESSLNCVSEGLIDHKSTLTSGEWLCAIQHWPDAITWPQWVKSTYNHQKSLSHFDHNNLPFISHIPFPSGTANNLKFHKLTTSVSKTSNLLFIQFRCFTLTTEVYQFDSAFTSCHWSLIHPDWSQTATKRLIFPELATGVTTVQSRMSICWPSQELTPWHGKNWEVCKNQAMTCWSFHPTYGSSSIKFGKVAFQEHQVSFCHENIILHKMVLAQQMMVLQWFSLCII